MKRILKTGPIPKIGEAISKDGVRVVTPHRAAAAALGVSSYTLPTIARDILRKSRGITVAPDVFARQTLKKVIARTFPGADPASIASRIREILRTVLRTGIDVDKLIERGSPRVRDLGVITKAYEAELLKERYIDRAELLWAAAQCDPARQPLYIYAHHRARKEEILFIDAAAGNGSTYVLPCHGDGIFTGNREWADELAARGWKVDDRAAGASETVGGSLAARFTDSKAGDPNTAAVAYPNIEAEVRGVLSRVKRMVTDGTDPYRIALVCRNQDDYGALIAAVAAEYGLPVRITYRVPLTETVLGGFVRLMLEAANQDFAYESAARLLMHPFGPEIPGGAWTAARLQHASGRTAWAALGIDLTSMVWPARQSFAAWTLSLRAVFGAFGVRRISAKRAREILALETFLDSLAEIEKFEGTGSLKFDEFSAIVAEVLADESVPFATASAGIALFEPNTIIGSSFDHLFVMGMAEGGLPAPASENPVIDFYERNLLGRFGIEFEEAAEVARWEALSFYFTLLAGRRSVTFSYPATVDNGERMPSAFFDRLGLKPEKAPLEAAAISSIEERRTVLLRSAETETDDALMAAARTQFTVELRRENSPVYDEYDGVIGVGIDPANRIWSASQLTAIGQCAFRWFGQRILRLDPVDEVEIGLDYTKRGTFYHRVLEIAVGKAIAEVDIRAATLGHLDASFAEAEADPEVALPTLVNWNLQRKEHIGALRKAVGSAEFIGEGSRVIGLEQKFETVWQGFRLVGYIDRIDETPAGLIAIDYKTSSSAPKGARDAAGKLSIDVQIPLYSKVALKKLYPDGKLGDSIYYSLVNGKTLRKEQPDDFKKLEDLAGRIRQTLASGNFAADPDTDVCKYCKYEPVCRKGPRLERKKNNQ